MLSGADRFTWTDWSQLVPVKKTRAAGGAGSGNFGHSGRPGEVGGSGEGGTPVTQTTAFKQWFGKSQVVDTNGDPLVVYHGTTHDVTQFAEAGSGTLNPESDWGAAPYFTSSTDDMSENYAGVGPDLTSRIEMRADEIESERDNYEGGGIGKTYVNGEWVASAQRQEAVAQATKELVGSAGAVGMPVYLSMQTPFVLGRGSDPDSPVHETYLTMESTQVDPTDENSDWNEPTGTLVDFAEALRNEASAFNDTQGVEPVIQTILEQGMDGGMSASELVKTIKDSEEMSYVTDDQGRLASHELVRRAVESVGFDGVIDRTVWEKFAEKPSRKGGMQAMAPDTVHYVTFKPTQVKSALGNRKFDPKNPIITLGGAGSGNFGHSGRPGEVGGSGSGEFEHHTQAPVPPGVLEAINQADGGFTYHAVTGEQPTTGYALSIHKDRESVMDTTTANAVALANYADRNWDLLSQKGNYLGGWHDPNDGKVYLDVSTVVKTAEEAEQMARDAQQIAYFDLVKGVSIKLNYGRRGLSAFRGDSNGSEAHSQPDRPRAGRTLLGGYSRARPPSDRSGAHSRGGGRGSPDSGSSAQPRTAGGVGSGNFGHAGRPGEVGGSGETSFTTEELTHQAIHAQARLDNLRDDLKSKNPDSDYRQHPEYQQALTRLTDIRRQLLVQQKQDAEITSQHIEMVRHRSEEIARQMGVDPSIIHIVDKEPTPFVVGNQQFKEAGHYDPSTGQIEINARNSYDDRMSVTNGIAAHEVSHAMYDAVRKERSREYQEMIALPVTERQRLFQEPEPNLRGDPRPEAIHELTERFPVTAMWGAARGEGFLKQDDTLSERMDAEDGHSAYAKSYWTPEALGQYAGSGRADNETLAEVTRYRVAPMSWHETETLAPKSPWLALSQAMQESYAHIQSRDRERAAYKPPDAQGRKYGEPGYRPKTLGGAGSGNFGHEGRPGEVGGSGSGSGGANDIPVDTTAAVALITGATGVQQVAVADTRVARLASRTVADTLAEMRSRGYRMPTAVTITSHNDDDLTKSTDITGETTRNNSIIIQVPDNIPPDVSLDEAVRKTYGLEHIDDNGNKTSDFSARTFKDVIVHEMGHVLETPTWQMAPKEFSHLLEMLSEPVIRKAAGQVSGYAHHSPEEFVAEAFTLQYRGERLKPEADAMYKALGGAKIR